MRIKNIGPLEGDILRTFSVDSIPMIVFDTSGLIDIATSIRRYNLCHRNGIGDIRYTSPDVFLRNLNGASKIIITPYTYKEVEKHSHTILNRYTNELESPIVSFSFYALEQYMAIASELKNSISLDEARYDAYWAAKYGCNGNEKKFLEGPSLTDKEILGTASYLANAEIKGQRINPLIVVSSDAHILKGVEFLRKEFEDKYSSLSPISTRY